MQYENLETLSSRHELVALYEASGLQDDKIAEITGFSHLTVKALRRSPVYQRFLEECKGHLREKVLDRASSLAEKFDFEAEAAFETLAEIHASHKYKGATRVKAAEGILDRAPSAPRKVRDAHGTGDAGVTIVFGVQTAENIGKALADTGRSDLIDLFQTQNGAFETPETVVAEEPAEKPAESVVKEEPDVFAVTRAEDFG